MPADHEYIDTPLALAGLCERLRGRTVVALDTEFIRERTYRPEVCLLQIKSGDLLALIDTLALTDLSPLLPVLYDPAVTKVLHAASQDLEIFYYLDRRIPAPVFDTQIAAPLLGLGEQIGYGNLVKEVLGVELSKAHTRADWSRRPLPEGQLKYALDDVIYLEQLYHRMTTELERLGRLSWLEPEFEALTDIGRYDKPARDMWKKLKMAQRLKGESLAVLQALAEWRELQARESNLPRTWLVKDDVLSDIARQLPESLDALSHVRGLGERTRQRHGEKLVELVKTARTRSPEPLPPQLRKDKPTPATLAVIDVLSALVNLKATELNINPSLLASRKALESCVAEGHCGSLAGWRYPLIGASLERLLSGQASLCITDGEVTVR